ncbi:MAG: NepR family anti-sigma factor [Hyphomonadaceae bacterium]
MDKDRAGEEEDDFSAPIDPEIIERQRMLGERLRAEFTQIEQEPTPDDFLSLLDELEEKERTGG